MDSAGKIIQDQVVKELKVEEPKIKEHGDDLPGLGLAMIGFMGLFMTVVMFHVSEPLEKNDEFTNLTEQYFVNKNANPEKAEFFLNEIMSNETRLLMNIKLKNCYICGTLLDHDIVYYANLYHKHGVTQYDTLIIEAIVFYPYDKAVYIISQINILNEEHSPFYGYLLLYAAVKHEKNQLIKYITTNNIAHMDQFLVEKYYRNGLLR